MSRSYEESLSNPLSQHLFETRGQEDDCATVSPLISGHNKPPVSHYLCVSSSRQALVVQDVFDLLLHRRGNIKGRGEMETALKVTTRGIDQADEEIAGNMKSVSDSGLS